MNIEKDILSARAPEGRLARMGDIASIFPSGSWQEAYQFLQSTLSTTRIPTMCQGVVILGVSLVTSAGVAGARSVFFVRSKVLKNVQSGIDLAAAAVAVALIEPLRLLCGGTLPELAALPTHQAWAWVFVVPLIAIATLEANARMSADILVITTDSYRFRDKAAAFTSRVFGFVSLLLSSAFVAIQDLHA